MPRRKTAGDLANQALNDKTKYDAREVAHASTDDVGKHLREAIENYRDKIDDNEFCVVMVIASDPLIKNLKRRKFYCWPYLPSPRPNQAVFLYNKALDRITKRLWVLPCAEVMAELATSDLIVHKQYETMQAWSVAFFKGRFWDFIRYQHDIKMLSQEEYFELNRDELLKSGINIRNPGLSEAFDFSKIECHNVGNPEIPLPV